MKQFKKKKLAMVQVFQLGLIVSNWNTWIFAGLISYGRLTKIYNAQLDFGRLYDNNSVLKFIQIHLFFTQHIFCLANLWWLFFIKSELSLETFTVLASCHTSIEIYVMLELWSKNRVKKISHHIRKGFF